MTVTMPRMSSGLTASSSAWYSAARWRANGLPGPPGLPLAKRPLLARSAAEGEGCVAVALMDMLHRREEGGTAGYPAGGRGVCRCRGVLFAGPLGAVPVGGEPRTGQVRPCAEGRHVACVRAAARRRGRPAAEAAGPAARRGPAASLQPAHRGGVRR